jgi:hypothetical protein
MSAAPYPPTTDDKPCRTCGAVLPPKRFYRQPRNRSGLTGDCKSCYLAKRRTPGAPARRPRYNARGDVWCPAHDRGKGAFLQPHRFKRHPLRPHTYWAYCRDCTIEIDRLRYRAKSRTPEAQAQQRARTQRRAQQRKHRQRERRAFVAEAILLLRRRGLTKADICRLADVSFGGLLKWERDEVCPSPNVAARLSLLLRETAHLAAQPEPAYRRRTPHPETPALMARVAPRLAAYPLRSRWRTA